MTLPKIKNFTDFNHYPSDPQPTTDADMQDYMLNQNDILTALTKRLWQPQTAYRLGDIVASDAMADGLVAVCTIAGVTSDIEPEWGVNEATVIDNSCTWIMRPAYCYGLATEGDVQTVHDGGSVEHSRLLSVGVLDKIFALIKDKFTDLFGSNDILPIEHGGTGATTASDACANIGALPLSGGTMTGAIYGVQTDTNGYALGVTGNGGRFKAGEFEIAKTGAYLELTKSSGEFYLMANTGDSTTRKALRGNVDGTLTWNTKKIELINSVSSNYIRFESGLQICWGNTVITGANDTTSTVTLPAAFKNTDYTVTGIGSFGITTSSKAYGLFAIPTITTSNFTCKKIFSEESTFRWVAIGYWK